MESIYKLFEGVDIKEPSYKCVSVCIWRFFFLSLKSAYINPNPYTYLLTYPKLLLQ